MNSLVLDVPAMTIEPQHCTIFMLDGAIKICTLYFKLTQYLFNHCANLQYRPIHRQSQWTKNNSELWLHHSKRGEGGKMEMVSGGKMAKILSEHVYS
jgi:hypothetical protein